MIKASLTALIEHWNFIVSYGRKECFAVKKERRGKERKGEERRGKERKGEAGCVDVCEGCGCGCASECAKAVERVCMIIYGYVLWVFPNTKYAHPWHYRRLGEARECIGNDCRGAPLKKSFLS